MPAPIQQTFTVEGGHLVQRVIPTGGQPYQNRCPESAYRTIARAVEEAAEAARPFTIAELTEATGVPHTAVQTALAFFQVRGLITNGPSETGRPKRVADPGFDCAEALDEWARLASPTAARWAEPAKDTEPNP